MEKSKKLIIDQCENDFPQSTAEFSSVIEEMYELFDKKQNDYGPGNIAMGTMLETEEEIRMSLMGIIVRMNDKINRLINLVVKKNKKPENESVIDSFIDIGNYSVIARILLERKWGK